MTQRTREIGIRMAIGATSSTIVRLIVVKAMALTGAGVAVGLVASVWVVRMLSTLVFGVGLMDPATFAAGTAILAAVALTASYFPARRAMMLDPVEALRSE